MYDYIYRRVFFSSPFSHREEEKGFSFFSGHYLSAVDYSQCVSVIWGISRLVC